MRQMESARVATCVVVAALVGAAGGLLPAEAHAADGTGPVSDLPAAMPTVDAALATVDATTAPVEDVVATALTATGTTPSTTPEEEPAPAGVGADGTEPAAPSSTQSPDGQVAENSAEPSKTGDTTPETGDTTVDTAPSRTADAAAAALPAAASAGALQSTATNVNVSVRIGSPGDNGPVTQVNVASAVTGGGATEPAATTPAAPKAPTGSTASPPVSASTPLPTSTAQDPGTWSWQWDCVSAPDLTAISGIGSANGSMPTNWTWIWNCGGNVDQYQGATSSQYQPSNVNVSIRVSSPGNDGPVSQSNVAVSVALPGGVRVPQGPGVDPVSLPGLPASFPAAVVVSTAPASVSSPSIVDARVSALLPVGDELGVTAITDTLTDSLVGTALDAVDAPLVLPSVVLRRPPARDPLGGPSDWRLPGLGSASVGRLPSDVLAVDVSTSAISRAFPVAQRTAPDITSGADTRPTPPPRWKAPAPPQPVPASAPSGASVAPASGGGSSGGGGIPIFLALPFLAAMLDLARRVTLDRVALPSDHRSRMPDDPG